MMKSILSILSIMGTLSTGEPTRGRIMGGQDASAGQFPYVVAVNDPDQLCQGIILTPSWVLTTAWCAYLASPQADAYVGSHLIGGNGTSYKTSKRILHTYYDAMSHQNDIALMRINGTLEYNDLVQAIELGGPPTPNATCTTVGWGTTYTELYPQNLQYVDVTVIDLETCQSLAVDHLQGHYLAEEQVCTLGEASCFGDYGGGLICDGKLVGVFSYPIADNCGKVLPNVFSSVAAYAEWIQDNLQD